MYIRKARKQLKHKKLKLVSVSLIQPTGGYPGAEEKRSKTRSAEGREEEYGLEWVGLPG